MKKKLLLSSLLLTGIGAISEYFFKFAMTAFNKKAESKELLPEDPLYDDKVWYNKQSKQEWQLEVEPKMILFAQYLDHHSNKTAVLLHGFMADGDSMAGFSKLFYDLGYNILLPDARAHGRSSGKYIGYGWVEKNDILRWIQELIAKKDSKQIVVMGQSMGGATAMMVSGLKLPQQVKCFIEDCGYASAEEEIIYQAHAAVGLPEIMCKPVVKIVSAMNKVRNGFFLRDASSIQQLKKNTRPFLFIHGKLDQVVPSKMVYENYAATKAPKELWVTPKAKHAESYPMYKTEYRQKVKAFLTKYVK